MEYIVGRRAAVIKSAAGLRLGTAHASDLYRRVRRLRGREIDLAIAACAIACDAAFWTLNPADFQDLPGLRMARVPV